MLILSKATNEEYKSYRWGCGVKYDKKSNLSKKSREALTLAILTVLVARSDGVHAVAGGAVRRRAVGLGGSEAVGGLDRLGALAAAG